jgi:hypothetical protein
VTGDTGSNGITPPVGQTAYHFTGNIVSNHRAISSRMPHRIHCCDLRSGKLIVQIDLQGGAPNALAVSPDSKTLAALTGDGGVYLRGFDVSPADGKLESSSAETG